MAPADLAELAARLAPDERGRLDGLLLLARRLAGSLAPVEARPGFVQELKAQLAAEHAALASSHQQSGQRRLAWMAGAGGLLYLVGLAFISFKAGLAAMSWIYGIMTASRASRGALAEVQVQPSP